MRVDIEEILALKARLREINSIPLEDIEWYENGQLVTVSPDVVNEYKFVGMGNDWFILSNAYKCQNASQFWNDKE